MLFYFLQILKDHQLIFCYSYHAIFSRYKRGSILPGPPQSGM